MTGEPETDALYEWLSNDGENKIQEARNYVWFFAGFFWGASLLFLMPYILGSSIVLVIFQLVVLLISVALNFWFDGRARRLENESKRLIRAQGKAMLERGDENGGDAGLSGN